MSVIVVLVTKRNYFTAKLLKIALNWMFLSERGMFTIHKNGLNSIVEIQEWFILQLFIVVFQAFVFNFKNIKVMST